jgi:hypothetical protein
MIFSIHSLFAEKRYISLAAVLYDTWFQCNSQTTLLSYLVQISRAGGGSILLLMGSCEIQFSLVEACWFSFSREIIQHSTFQRVVGGRGVWVRKESKWEEK